MTHAAKVVEDVCEWNRQPKIDYVLLSPRATPALREARSFAKASGGGKNGTLFLHYPTMTSSVHAAADHARSTRTLNSTELSRQHHTSIALFAEPRSSGCLHLGLLSKCGGVLLPQDGGTVARKRNAFRYALTALSEIPQSCLGFSASTNASPKSPTPASTRRWLMR